MEDLPSKHVIGLETTIEERFRPFYKNTVCGAKTGGTRCQIKHGGTDAGAGLFLFDSASQGFDQGEMGGLI